MLQLSSLRVLIPAILMAFTLGCVTGCVSNGVEPYVGADGQPLVDAEGNLQLPRTILDRLEFDADEYGCVDLRGQIDLNPAPMFTSNANIVLKKVKAAPDGTISEC